MAGYQSIFTGGKAPTAAGPNPFANDFHPGQYAAINAAQTQKSAKASRLAQLMSVAQANDRAVQGNKNQTLFGKIAQYGPGSVADTAKATGSGFIAPERKVAQYISDVRFANRDQNAANKAASDQSNLLKQINALQKSGKISKQQSARLMAYTAGNLDQLSQTATENTARVQDETSPRKVIAATAETALTPFISNPIGETSNLALAGQGITGGVLGAFQADKVTPKSVIKSAVEGTVLPVLAGGSSKLINSVKGAKAALQTAEANKLLNKAKLTNDLGKVSAGGEKIPEGQKLLTSGQKKLSAVTDSTKSSQRLPRGTTLDERINGSKGGTFGKAATGPAKVAKAQTKVEMAISSINEKLAKVDRGEITMSPEERKQLFQTRLVLTGKAPAVRPETQDLVKAVTEAHAKVSPVSTEKVVANAPKISKEGKSYGTVSTATGEKAFNEAKAASKKTILGSLKSKFNPVAEYGAKGKQALSEFQSKLGQLSYDLRPVQKESAARQAIFDKMSQEDRLKFIDNVQHGLPQTTPELQKLADTYTQFNKQGAEIAGKLNPNFKTRNNYFTQSGLLSKQDVSDQIKSFMDKSNLPGSTKARTFDSVREAVKFANDNNIPLRETNPEKLFMNNHQAVLTSGRLNEFKAEQAAQGVDPAITQKIIDRFSERGISNSPLFQRYRQGAGSLNNVQLVGGFHFAKSAFEKINNDVSTTIKEITAGHPIFAAKDAAKNIIQNAKGLGYLQGRGLARDVEKGVSNKYTEAAKLANFNTTTDSRFAVKGLSDALKQTAADIGGHKLGSTLKDVGKLPFATINTVMKPLMNKFVPNLKNAAFMNQVDAADHILGPNATKEARALAYQKAGNTVDGIMGQMNQDNLFWSKTSKDMLSVAMRSPGYNIGTVQQVGGGLKDLVSPSTIKALSKGQGLSTRSSYALAMTANTMALGAVTTYLFTGKGPKDLVDYFYPPTGKTDKNGNKERISLPSYAKDVFAFSHNPGQTVANKLSPALTTGLEAIRNKDYFGNMVRNPEDSKLTQVKQTLQFLGKNALPFSVTNANQRVDKGAGAKAESLLGLGVAPGYITKSPFEQKVSAALSQATGAKSLTPEEQKVIASKSAAKQAAQAGDFSKIDDMVSSGQLTQRQGDNLKVASANSSLANAFNYLLQVDRPAAAKLISQAKPEDIKNLGNLKSILQDLAYTVDTDSPTTSQATKDASSKLLQVLNKQGYNVSELAQQKKDAIKAKTEQTRSNKIYGR